MYANTATLDNASPRGSAELRLFALFIKTNVYYTLVLLTMHRHYIIS